MAKEPSFDLSLVKACYFNLSDKTPFIGVISRLKAGEVYHSHSQFDMHYGLEFGIVMSGRKDLIFPDLTIHLSSGNVWFCGMWEPHCWTVGRQPKEEINFIIWPPALASLHFNESPELDWLEPFTLPPEERPQTNATTRGAMLEIGAKMKKCLKTGGEKRDILLRLYIMEAILLSARKSKTRENLKLPSGSAESLNQILKCFFEKRGLMTTAGAARMCGMGRNTFGMMFRRLMGLSFADFGLRYRLNSAASCLRWTNDSIKNIAFSWGFADTSHFDRLFAKFYGCPPHEYRHRKIHPGFCNGRIRPKGRAFSAR